MSPGVSGPVLCRVLAVRGGMQLSKTLSQVDGFNLYGICFLLRQQDGRGRWRTAVFEERRLGQCYIEDVVRTLVSVCSGVVLFAAHTLDCSLSVLVVHEADFLSWWCFINTLTTNQDTHREKTQCCQVSGLLLRCSCGLIHMDPQAVQPEDTHWSS